MSKFVIEKKFHPVTNEQVFEAIYTNDRNTAIRGSVIGTASEIKSAPIRELEGWSYVYTGCVTPRAWTVYEKAGYKLCWGQEIISGRDLVPAEMPNILN